MTCHVPHLFDLKTCIKQELGSREVPYNKEVSPEACSSIMLEVDASLYVESYG